MGDLIDCNNMLMFVYQMFTNITITKDKYNYKTKTKNKKQKTKIFKKSDKKCIFFGYITIILISIECKI